MSNKPISDLRRRMIADMTIRTFSDKTQREPGRQPRHRPTAPSVAIRIDTS
jgi:hypothetical protein